MAGELAAARLLPAMRGGDDSSIATSVEFAASVGILYGENSRSLEVDTAVSRLCSVAEFAEVEADAMDGRKSCSIHVLNFESV
jgi:hypothetical protein